MKTATPLKGNSLLTSELVNLPQLECQAEIKI